MDPNSGKLYPSPQAALKDGVKNPVEIIGSRKQAEQISKAVKAQAAKERFNKQQKNRSKKKVAKNSRKVNR